MKTISECAPYALSNGIRVYERDIEFIRYNIALWRVRQEQIPTTRYRYGPSTLHPGPFLSGSNLGRQMPLRLQRRQRS